MFDRSVGYKNIFFFKKKKWSIEAIKVVNEKKN